MTAPQDPAATIAGASAGLVVMLDAAGRTIAQLEAQLEDAVARAERAENLLTALTQDAPHA